MTITAQATPGARLLSPKDHTLILIDFQSQMAFATKSIDAVSLRNNAALVAKAACEFGVSTILTTVAEKSFSGPIFDEIKSVFPDHQVIDRTTVPELGELVSSGTNILSLTAGFQAHLNSLGLAHDAMAFDISPAEVAAGKSHFEQIYERAVKASVNAKNAFHQAGKMNIQLRHQNDSLDEYNDAVTRQESAYEYQLISLYGTAYGGDMGPGKLYAQGYTGPDLYHSYFIDRPSPIINTDSTVTMTFREPINTDPFRDWTLKTPNTQLTVLDYPGLPMLDLRRNVFACG